MARRISVKGFTPVLPSWKTFPVDVQGEDGGLARGFVQDAFDDGKLLVHFDCKDDPLQIVDAGRVFRTRGLTEPKTSERRRFRGKCKVEVLVRASPDTPARWYAGVVESAGTLGAVVDVKFAEEVIRKGVFYHCKPSSDIQRASPRVRGTYTKIPVGIPRGVDISSISEEFCVEWYKRTGGLVKRVDVNKNLLMVLADEQHPRPPTGVFRRIVAGILKAKEADGATARGEKRTRVGADGGDCEHGPADIRPSGKRTTRSTTKVMESVEAPVALMIPEMLFGIIRLLDLKDKHVLRKVSRTWKDIIESPQVCRSVHFDDSRPRDHTTMDRCRYFTRLHQDYLTTVTVCCVESIKDWHLKADFLSTLVFIGPALVPRMKTLILHNGLVCSCQLVKVLAMKNAPRILLRNVTVPRILVGSIYVDHVHVQIKSSALDPALMTNIAVENALENDDLRWSEDDEFERAAILVRNLLVALLDGTPLERSKDDILADVTKIPEGPHLDKVRIALKVLDPGCFTPEMDEHGAEILRVKSPLRNATLHVCNAIAEAFNGT